MPRLSDRALDVVAAGTLIASPFESLPRTYLLIAARKLTKLLAALVIGQQVHRLLPVAYSGIPPTFIGALLESAVMVKRLTGPERRYIAEGGLAGALFLLLFKAELLLFTGALLMQGPDTDLASLGMLLLADILLAAFVNMFLGVVISRSQSR